MSVCLFIVWATFRIIKIRTCTVLKHNDTTRDRASFYPHVSLLCDKPKWLRAIFCRPTDMRVVLIITSNSAQKQRSTLAEMSSWWYNDFIYGLLILQVIQLTFDQAELISSRHFWASTQCANVGVQANIRGSLAEHYELQHCLFQKCLFAQNWTCLKMLLRTGWISGCEYVLYVWMTSFAYINLRVQVPLCRGVCIIIVSLPLCGCSADISTAEWHRGNKQQQLSRIGLIKHSASALQPADYSSLDQSRPDWPCQRHAVAMITDCHGKGMPGRKRSRRHWTVPTVAHPRFLQPLYSRALGSTCSA